MAELDKPLVIGVGNRYRQDDGFGLVLLDKLRQESPGLARYMEAPGDLLDLLDLWHEQPLVVLLDCLHIVNGVAGEVCVIDPDHQSLPELKSPASSHALGIAEAFKFGQVLAKRPERLVIIGAVGESFAPVNELTPKLTQALEPAKHQFFELMGGSSCMKQHSCQG